MIGDAFVFDSVAHLVNLEKSNERNAAATMLSGQFYDFHKKMTPASEKTWSPEQFFREWQPQDLEAMLFDQSPTDIAVAHPLPMDDLYTDGLSSWQRCAAMAERSPERTIFWGTVNPLEGRRAVELVEHQIKDHKARAFKFYNIRYDYGDHFFWRMDDAKVAFPVYDKMLELGVNLCGVHKGVPLGPQHLEHTTLWDMDGAAEKFPDMNFVIFHVGLPWLDEACWQVTRFPNLYVSIAATINFVVRAPRHFAEIIGKLLFWCGEDKIIYGSEAPFFHPNWALKAFWDFEIPQDLIDGYGYPQLTREAKRKILGGNLLRLHGMEQPAPSKPH
jgi:predicted TIM-barrel fold metal-dependent hydrolase